MRNEDDLQRIPDDSSDGDDVEILEVVGIEEEASMFGIPRREAVEAPDDPDEIVLGFDDDQEAPGSAPRERGREPQGRNFTNPSRLERVPASDRDLLLRMRADYENLRKRIDRERHDFELQANSALVGRLLPTLDNFERALAVEMPPGAAAALREGLLMIYRQLSDELRREGLQAIESIGRPFDPEQHDAVATDPSSQHPPNTVVEEFQRGYLFQDRVLRPASVRVSTTGLETSSGDGRSEGP